MKKVDLETIIVGNHFFIGDVEFVVLNSERSVCAVTRDVIAVSAFGKDNEYRYNNTIGKVLSEFEKKLLNDIDKEDIRGGILDLDSDTGFCNYGYCENIDVAPMTLLEYTSYGNIMEQNPVDQDWWLATPHGGRDHGSATKVCCISKEGTLENASCRKSLGVRPVIYFSPYAKVMRKEKK